jgi:hypothetical protein
MIVMRMTVRDINDKNIINDFSGGGVRIIIIIIIIITLPECEIEHVCSQASKLTTFYFLAVYLTCSLTHYCTVCLWFCIDMVSK